MKKIKESMLLVVMSSLLCVSNAYAIPLEHGSNTSVEEVSELLPKGVQSDIASETSKRRGEFFARADLVITDQGNGNIGAMAKAYMDHGVDEVYISIYLDQWDEEKETWEQVAYYDAEFYAEDYPEGLTDPTVDITFLDQERDHYYRLRRSFSAVYEYEYEGFSPTTSGIWID